MEARFSQTTLSPAARAVQIKAPKMEKRKPKESRPLHKAMEGHQPGQGEESFPRLV